MKLCFAFLIFTSCILLYCVRCHEGVYKIPEMSSKVEVKSIVPKCFMDRVDDLFKTRGPYNLKAENASINPKKNRQVFNLVVSEIRDGISELLDQFTVLVVAMLERNKKLASQEHALDFMELSISKLSGCLEFLYDNEAEVTDVLTGYIFYSDIKCIFKTYYGEKYTYSNITGLMFVRIEKQQWHEYSQRVPTEETYQELCDQVEKSLEDISKVYQQLVVVSSDWLSPQCLKWRNLFESKSKIVDHLNQVIVVDNGNIRARYLQIAREFDWAKVMDFYVKVGKALDDIVLETANDLMVMVLNLLLGLNVDDSNQDNIFTQINRAQRILDDFLTSVNYLKNWMSYSKRLTNSKTIHSSPAIGMLQKSIVCCQKYISDDFPTVVEILLAEFKEIYNKSLPDFELEFTKITNGQKWDSIAHINIIDNMEKKGRLMETMLHDIKSSI